MHETARRILESGDFRFGPEAREGILAWLLRKLRDLLEAIGALRESHPVIAWIIIVLCVVILLLIAWHAWTILSRSIRASRGRRAGGEPSAKRERAAKILDAARKAVSSGDFARALTLYLEASIAGLDERGIQRRTETATIREYLVLLRSHPRERSLLERLAFFYEPGVFGRRPVGPEPMGECDGVARRLAGEDA